MRVKRTVLYNRKKLFCFNILIAARSIGVQKFTTVLAVVTPT